MKTYILRDPNAVQPQKAGLTSFVGLDVLNDSIAVSLAPADITEGRRYRIIGSSHDDEIQPAQTRRINGRVPGFRKCPAARSNW